MIKEGEFGVTYFTDIYSGVPGKWYNHQVIIMSVWIHCHKYGVKFKTSLGFWENKGWINK